MQQKYFYLMTVIVTSVLTSVLTAVLLRPPDAVGAGPAGRAALPAAAPVGSGFTYQGFLEDGGGPANALYDFEFKLYDALNAGNQVGSTVTANDVPVFEGLFSVKLDFGSSAFGGGSRWLDIGVRPGNSGGAYTPLTPRQELTPAPSALSLPNVYTDESLNFVGIGRDFRISGNEVFGIRYTGGSDQYGGMYVETSDAGGWPFYGYATNGSFRAWTYYNGNTGDWYLYNAGIRLHVPNEGGLRIGPSANYSLVISNTTGSDGIRVLDTGDDGIQIGSDPDYPNYGVYIPSPGVSAYGLWPNTANAQGEWALFTVDKINAGNVAASTFSLIAQVTGAEALTTGDVVGVSGVAQALPGGQGLLPLVGLAASGQPGGLIGVVDSRMVLEAAPGKEAEGELALHSVDGPAQPGDYVALVVFGVAQVKVDPQASITAGQRLTASDLSGRVRALQTQTVNDMLVTEGAQAVGIALAAPETGQETIPVFVTLR